MSTEVPLDTLLAHWRTARHPSTSELIQHLGDRLKVELPRLPAKKTDAAKMLLAGVKSEPAVLLSARLKQLEAFTRTTTASLAWPLFEALAKLPADPRIATLATRLLVGDVDVPLTAKLTRRLLDCVETHGDDSHHRVLELGFPLNLLEDGLAARTVRMLQRGLAQRPVGPELPQAERKRLAETTWEVPTALPPATESLYAPIWAAPRDLSLRQVLADRLLEQGDPRGEFIALQLAGASLMRQRALLKAHGRQWLGTLAEVIDLKDQPPLFQQGFVAEVSVRAVKSAQFLLASEAPEWATVRRVRRGLQRFSKTMTGLEDAGLVKLEALKAAAREALPLTLRSVVVAALPDQAVDVLERLAAPPRWLGLHFGQFEPTRELRDSLPRLGDLPGLERLRFSAESETVMPALLGQMGLSWLPSHLTRVELRDDERLVILERERKQWRLELVELDTNGPVAHRWKEILLELTWLQPASVRLSVRCEVDDSGVKELEQLARRFKQPVTTAELEDVPAELAW
ncbi:MAG: hypothetical protein Q8K32_04095 [Archangium sp.]|nr:hypothetical protein [Archangium sp.]